MESINTAIEEATTFIFNNQNDDGMWYNFLTRHHGESADWVSSYVGLNLLKSGIDQDLLTKTAKSVLERQRENGGFSYNHKIVPDADSTAFAIRFLSHFGYQKELDDARAFLAKHQHEGGFRTYQEQAIRNYARIPLEMSVAGWCTPTPDVTASVLLTGMQDKSAEQFLLKSQQEDGQWHSYWWTSDVYATSHSLEALSRLGYKDEVTKGQEWLAQEANVPDIPFYLALSIQSLLENEEAYEIVKTRAEKLLLSQRNDGSWNTMPTLQFPLPSNTNPHTSPGRWRPDARDQNRIFTTSACIRALNKYQRISFL